MALFRREGDLIQVSVKNFVFLAVLFVLVGFGGGAAVANARGNGSVGTGSGDDQQDAKMGDQRPPSSQVMLAPEGRPSMGSADAAVTIVEFTDYDCPFCRRYYFETFPRIMEAYGDRIRYVLRHFPLVSMHPEAVKAAEAADCALDQGRFWEYHDLLLRRPSALDIESLKQNAAEVGVNTSEFNRCLDEGLKEGHVQRDLRDGFANGVRGTPSFFINGHPLTGAQPLDVFTAYIEAELANSGN